jgi:hydrogenase expression/formation protein HypC
MCLAVPAKVVECSDDEAVVDLQGSSLRISRILTPDAGPGDWVLVHAGFAITQLDETEARETWDYLREAFGEDAAAILGDETGQATAQPAAPKAAAAPASPRDKPGGPP